ncbi:MAG: hypothetical protein J6S85_09080 [Methanobrevibacter sp.]|nr:hypothetical protein [Methanobrevibacter sp.]
MEKKKWNLPKEMNKITYYNVVNNYTGQTIASFANVQDCYIYAQHLDQENFFIFERGEGCMSILEFYKRHKYNIL